MQDVRVLFCALVTVFCLVRVTAAQELEESPPPECLERQEAVDRAVGEQQRRLSELLAFLDRHGVPYTSLRHRQSAALRVDSRVRFVAPDFEPGPARLSVGVGSGCSLPSDEPFVCVLGAVFGRSAYMDIGCAIDATGLTFGVRLYPRHLSLGTVFIPLRGGEGLVPEPDVRVAYERAYVVLGSDLLNLREHVLNEFFDVFDRFATANP